MGNQATGGLFSPYLARRRLAAASPWLKGRVLDFGCGGGNVAAVVSPDRYVGVDRDAGALESARRRYPQHRFMASLPDGESFDTICMLAVIEHLPDPPGVLSSLQTLLLPHGRLVFTTPTPLAHLIQSWGARVGLFSREAAEEHEHQFDLPMIRKVLFTAQYSLEKYDRFLLGLNQLVVMRPTYVGPRS